MKALDPNPGDDAHGSRFEEAVARYSRPLLAIVFALFLWDRYVAGPDDPAVELRQYADELVRTGHAIEALPVLHRLNEIDSTDLAVHYNLARSLAEVGQHDDALAEYDRALALQPGHPIVQRGRGWTLLQLNRFEESVAEFDSVLRYDDRDVDAHVGIARALGNMRRMEEAAQHARVAIALEPGNAWAHAALAIASLRTGDVRQAVRSAREAVRLEPGDGALRETLALTLIADGHYIEAEQALLAKVRLGDTKVPGWLQLARVARLNEHWALADSAYGRVYQLMPRYFESSDEDRRAWEHVRDMREAQRP